MNVPRSVIGSVFCVFFVVSYFCNKYVLSVLKFTFPTLFQGWQTFIGALLLLLSGKLGWVEISTIPRSAALAWLPGSLLFVGNIYAGSRALSRLPIPSFFTLHNASEAISAAIVKITQRERMSWMKMFSVHLLLIPAVVLPHYDPQFDLGGYLWALLHITCVGAYRVFQKKTSHLSDVEQQYINYFFSVLLLAVAAHPTGDLIAVLEFPFLMSYKFHSGCCASAAFSFFLLLTTFKLKNGLPLEQTRRWVFLAKCLASGLSPLVFSIQVTPEILCCFFCSHAGEALSVYSEGA
ncbi:transmembrane protein 241 [Denticeps clupeoides]|uniref:Transmembrane protein 241 n=1 Tax=Denticeps clupeoides TaxID=299321 RepID=A0AAY4A167_9TELE|nr:transmembrane protein 241 [Denticeps clupeoides]